MTTDDHSERDTSSLSDIVLIPERLSEASHTLVLQLQASAFDCGRFCSGRRHLPVMMNDGDGGTIDGGAFIGGV